LRLLCSQRILDASGVVEIAEPFLLREQSEELLRRAQLVGTLQTSGPSRARHVRSTQRANELSAARSERGVEARASGC
jgi:hypothetical protein